ncbi:MAG TPA: type II toxin-antitoxin system prevent-host-death family antitoxin [Candidatus Ornithomonoglobus merdipullorum]|uniref:Antitoxin n=1 Tax=Candidatus Ornithomonoglobus merdipullorum TaxID=2840895 RepID=A0A9D1MA11_9FIRM|nr:type II toxin-antitoxin system prevent-host-death family antitoxin [Candidatus Ornithomonoglobus merdipullorum]
MKTATATELQNNFAEFLSMVQKGEEIIIVKNGSEIARIVPNYNKGDIFLTDSLVGVLKGDYDEKDAAKERMQKYESFN